MRTRTDGYTLIELLISLAVIGILTALATASYAAVKSRWDSEEARAALYTGFFTAKTQAIAGGIQTVICPSNDGQYCLASNQWHFGWIVFQDINQNREHEADEARLKVQPALSSRTRLGSNAGRTRLVFQPNGSNGGTNATFTLCDGRGPETAKNLIISNTGRIRTAPADPSAAAQICL